MMQRLIAVCKPGANCGSSSTREYHPRQAHALAREISRKIEEQLQYPGQIRVTVVRETRCVEYAK